MTEKEAKAKADRLEFLEVMRKTLDLAGKLKRAMKKKNLRRARAVCPDCPGKYLHGTINGKRDHLHFACECGKYRMME